MLRKMALVLGVTFIADPYLRVLCLAWMMTIFFFLQRYRLCVGAHRSGRGLRRSVCRSGGMSTGSGTFGASESPAKWTEVVVRTCLGGRL